MKYLACLLILLLTVSPYISAQNVTFSSDVRPEMEVCGDAVPFAVTVHNTTGAALVNPELTLRLPDGIEYVGGSLSESSAYNLQEFNVSQDTALVFRSNTLPAGDSIVFSLSYLAGSGAIAYQNSSAVFRNHLEVSYQGGSDNHESDSYNILYPALSILSVAPTAQTIVSGASTQRSITIINGGNGKTDAIFLTDVRSSGLLTLDATSIGTLNGDTIWLSGNDFSGVGNNDGFLDQNESIVITQTLSGTNCTDLTVNSAINAFWGCGGVTTGTSTSYANVTIDFQSPNVKLAASESLETCFGSGAASAQELRVINKGSGMAAGIAVELYKSSGSGYDQDIFSRIDASSLSYKIGISGAATPVSGLQTTATQASGDYACLGSNPVGKVNFNLGNLAPGDTAYITWDMYACCVQTCVDDAVRGWEADVDYTDVCGSLNYAESLTGQEINHQYMSFTTESPIDIESNTPEIFTFIVSSFENTLPAGTGAAYQATFTLDPGLVYQNIRFYSNGIDWVPSQVNYDTGTNTVVATFPAPAPFVVPKSEIDLTLTGNCGVSGWQDIELNLAYLPDVTCNTGCAIPLACDVQTDTYLHCPLVNCNGLAVLDFDLARINFGSPDNDQNGLADASGSLDMSKIKTNRAMVGDTIRGRSRAVVQAGTDTWAYSGFSSEVDAGSVLDFISARLIIYDASAATSYVVDGLTANSTVNGAERSFAIDLSAGVLASLNPALTGYTFAGGDSLTLDVEYEVAASVAGLLREVTFLNEFYLSDFSNPTAAQKESCNVRNGRITLIGYAWRNDSRNSTTVTSCSKEVNQYFGMSIGDLGSNYGGGNLFPYEYRHWGYATTARVVIPAGYHHVSTRMKHYRTRKTNEVATETINGLAPDLVSGDTLFYDLQQYYLSNQWKYSDDGFHGRIYVEIAPDCDVVQNNFEDVSWTFNYQKTAAIDGNPSGPVTASSPDRIRYQPPVLQILSNNPMQDANTRKISWDLKVQNTASGTAQNAWVHLDLPGNITIDSLVRDGNGQPLVQQGDLYLLGAINGGSTTDLTLYATVSGCDTVNFTAFTGFDCAGYPSSFSNFACSIDQVELYVEPKPAAYQTRISAQLMPDPCIPQVEITVDITSVKIGHMYDMQIAFFTADTSKIKVLNGSSEFQYNISNAYTSISDPVYAGGIYQYNINDYESSFAGNGIPGVLDITNNRYRLRATLELGSQFVPGDYLQIQINGENACAVALPTINLAYDPNSKFAKDNTAGLHLEIGNSWSASWGDYDNDGYDDLFVPVNDITEPNILYHNNGDGTFSKANVPPLTTDLGTSISGSWGDYDNDGFLDLFVANNTNSSNKLYHNNGDGTFTSISNSPIVDEGIYSHAASWADYNLDGNLDLVVSDFHPTHFNVLFQGDGQGGFVADASSVVALSATSAIGVAWGDYDNDGDPDLFIANTNGQNNQLFRNDMGVFVAVTTGDLVNDGGSSAGGTWGDYDNDGDLDLYVTNTSITEANCFYENNGDGTFTKITNSVIVAQASNSHGASWSDYDNDGDLDLLVANDQNQRNFLFANNGDKTFSQMTNAITEDENDAYGTAWSDYDNDGDYDLFIANRGSNANDFFINEKGSCTNHIAVKLEGCNSNSFGIGALVRVKSMIGGNPVWQTKHVSTQTSAMGGQNSTRLLFGLSDGTAVDSLVVQWPSGVVTYVVNPALNQLHTIQEPCGAKVCGILFHDLNNNQVQDPGENGIPNQSLRVQPGDFQLITDANGYYEGYLVDGNYTLELVGHPNWTQTFPASSYALSIVQASQSVYCGNDFACTPVCTQPDLSIELGTTAFRRGLTNMLNVTVKNEGAYGATGLIDLDLTLSDNVYLVDSLWTSVSQGSGSRTYTYQLNGLAALSDTLLELTDSVAVSAALDDPVSLNASVSYVGGECSTGNNGYAVVENVVGSVDPNDKQVFVQGFGSKQLAAREEVLLYKIRFQNLGNYAARIVHLIDTLSTDLDWATFKMESSSHPFAVSVVNGIVNWRNDAIELPDSASDPLGSQGFVLFSISPKAGIAPYTLIENEAHIQFDYNGFITTNMTEIVIGGAARPRDETYVQVYPNPSSTSSEILLVDAEQKLQTIAAVMVYDVQGQRLQELPGGSPRIRLDVRDLRTGVYLLKVIGADGGQYRSRFSVVK